MAHYKENFDLDETDIELIEDTVRNEIRVLTHKKQHEQSDAGADDESNADNTIKRLNMLLGKLHNQKIWYSQVNHTGVPLG